MKAIAVVVGASLPVLVAQAAVVAGQQAGTRVEPALARLEVGAKRAGWDGIELGMSLVQVERRAGQTLAVTPTGKPGCGAAKIELDHHSLQLSLDLDGAKPGAKVRRILVRFEGYQIAAGRADLVEELRGMAPGIVYLPPSGSPETIEADDPRPTYLLPGAAGSAVRLMPRFGLLLASRDCLEN